MKITVKDCLELDAFKPCIVSAGRRNLQNTVRSISVMDARDVKTAVEHNGVRDQLVLTSFYAMKDDVVTQAQVVRELAACGIAGLVVFHARNGITAADSETIDIAEDGTVYRNGEALEENYVNELALGEKDVETPITVPESRYFVCGDICQC